jgi:hypothetical protein
MCETISCNGISMLMMIICICCPPKWFKNPFGSPLEEFSAHLSGADLLPPAALGPGLPLWRYGSDTIPAQSSV